MASDSAALNHIFGSSVEQAIEGDNHVAAKEEGTSEEQSTSEACLSQGWQAGQAEDGAGEVVAIQVVDWRGIEDAKGGGQRGNVLKHGFEKAGQGGEVA